MTVFCFDGTGNHRPILRPNGKVRRVDAGGGTNVAKLSVIMDEPVCYLGGVGNPIDFKGWHAASSLAYSMGCKALVDKMLDHLEERLNAHDQLIDIIGLGRGGHQAIEFANRLADDERPFRIRFMGLFDPVHASTSHDRQLRSELPLGIHIDRYCEVFAFHESRMHLQCLCQQDRESLDAGTVVQEVAKGSHDDVGGGCANTGLSDMTLQWMIDQAKHAGIKLKPADAWQICDELLMLRPDPEQLPHRHFDTDYPPKPRRFPLALLERVAEQQLELGDWHKISVRNQAWSRSKILMNLDPYIEDADRQPGYKIIKPKRLFPKSPRPNAAMTIERKLSKDEILELMTAQDED